MTSTVSDSEIFHCFSANRVVVAILLLLWQLRGLASGPRTRCMPCAGLLLADRNLCRKSFSGNLWSFLLLKLFVEVVQNTFCAVGVLFVCEGLESLLFAMETTPGVAVDQQAYAFAGGKQNAELEYRHVMKVAVPGSHKGSCPKGSRRA